MQRFSRKYIVVLALAIVLAMLLLVGCRGDDAADGAGANVIRPDLPAGTMQVEGPDYIFERFYPPITITQGKFLSTAYQFRPGESMEENEWLDWIYQDLGIRIDTIWSVLGSNIHGDAAEQMINVRIASGDLPDIFRVNSAQLSQLAEADLIEDLTDMWEELAMYSTRDVMNSDGGYALRSAHIGGRLMGLPVITSNFDQAIMLWVRQDWLDNLGLDLPRTMDDVFEIARAFTEDNPAGTGYNNTFGLGLNMNIFEGSHNVLRGFFEGFGGYVNAWIDDGQGGLMYGGIQPEIKTALGEVARMFAAGQIDPEFGVQDNARVNELIVQGRIGMTYGLHHIAYNPLHPSNDLDGANWVPVPIVSATGTPATPVVGLATTSYIVQRRGLEQNDVLMRLANHFCVRAFGGGYNEQFMVYDCEETHMQFHIFQLPPFFTDDSRKNVDMFRRYDYMFRTGNTEGFPQGDIDGFNWLMYYRGEQGTGSFGFYKWVGPGGAMSIVNHYVENSLILSNAFTGALTPAMANYGSFLNTMKLEAFTRIIMGIDDLDAFDEFAEHWWNLGGEQMTAEVNEWFDSNR
ncbi:MAG: extracellular solute-binding protein [Defluviitaleaceae bacterium]|nr:extracellular solute-binding protein [Defluviitaleaceae bacterium]